MTSENGSLNSHLTEKLAQIEKLEKEARSLRSSSAQLKALKKANAELTDMVSLLEKDMTRMGHSLEELSAGNAKLRAENMELADRNAALDRNVSQLQEVAINNSLVQAVQGKKQQRLTVVAKRTKGIKMDVDLHATMTNGLTMKVMDPSGKELTAEDGTISMTEILDDANLTASLVAADGELVAAKRMHMEFAPKGKMKKGVYTLEVTNGKRSLGKTQISLR